MPLMVEGPAKSRRQRAMVALAGFVCRRALWIVIASVALAAISMASAWAELEFISDRNALVSPETDYNKRFMEFTRAFGDQELMLFMVSPAPGPEADPDFNPLMPEEATRAQMKRATAEVCAELRKRADLFPQLVERVPPDSFGGTRMLYLPEADLQAIESQVTGGAPMLGALAADPSYPALLDGLHSNIETATPAGADEKALREGGESMASLVRALRQALAAPAVAPGMEQMFRFRSSDPTLDEDGYFFVWEGRVLFVPMLPAKDTGALSQIQEPLDYARDLLARVAPKYPQLAFGLSGRPVIYNDEMTSTSRDMTLATILSFIGVAIMFAIAFRSLLRPMLAMVALGLAICWTIGATTLVIGHLNIFAMVFGVVLVGLGVDFGIHLLNHYRIGLSHGLSVRDSLTQVYTEIGMGTITGAVTTAVALATAVFTDFHGLAELGIICGIGIMLCLAAMLITFPAMLVLVDVRRIGEGNPVVARTMQEADARPAPIHRRVVMPVLVAVAILAALAVTGVQAARGWKPFDYNLLALNDPNSRGIVWEKLLIQHDQRASYAVSTRESLAEIAALRAQLEPLRQRGLIRGFDSMAPDNEASNREILARIAKALPPRFAAAPAQPATVAGLRAAARRLQGALNELSTRGTALQEAFAPVLEELRGLAELLRDQAEPAQARMDETAPAFFATLRGNLDTLRRDCAPPPPPAAATLPTAMRSRYVGKADDGRELHALYIYPARDAWDHDNAGEFNDALRQVDPEVTGVTIQVQESGNVITRGFAISALYALVAIVALLFLDLRRPLAVLVSMLPLFGSLALLLGVMTLADLHFNFANFFSVPILIGTAVDSGVYLVHSQRHGDPRRTVAATVRACILVGLSNIIGFSTLLIASHRGVVSLGIVMTIAYAACVVATIFIVPPVLAWFNERGKRL